VIKIVAQLLAGLAEHSHNNGFAEMKLLS